MNMKKIFFLLMVLGWLNGHAIEPRNLLQKQAGPAQLKQILLDKSQWIKYPAYTDRTGWDKLSGSAKAKLIKDGEANLKYEWKLVPASAYLEYERSGSRTAMENIYYANNKALSVLVFAELAEGKGRFIPAIIDGVWQFCDMPSWAISAHLRVQKTGRSLPDMNETIIELVSADMGSFLSWTWYFLKDEFNKVDPVINRRILKLLKERILEPYMQRSDYWWQALGKEGVLVNNWNPWCNANVLTCFLLLEDNKDSLTAAVYKTMQSTDQFINYVKSDGACEEGPSYWTHAAGKLYDYLQILYTATGGKINLFGEPMIRKMGEYISRSYVGNGWVVNFADASAKGGGDEELIYRYGAAVGSEEMQQYAAYLFQRNNKKLDPVVARDFFRSIESLSTYPLLSNTKAGLADFRFTWYPQTEVLFLKNNSGFFLAAKGGFNNESHNHNDVGSFSLYYKEVPFFIDAGVGTYTRQTFGPERYTIWTMQCDYHNLPMINGRAQPFGEQYKAGNVVFDSVKNRFSLDIAGAYDKETEVKKWVRSYELQNDGLVIKDQFELNKLLGENKIHFMTWAKPDLSKSGEAKLEKDGKILTLYFDPALFEASVAEIKQEDKRLSTVWGESLYRLELRAKKQVLKGNYVFRVK